MCLLARHFRRNQRAGPEFHFREHSSHSNDWSGDTSVEPFFALYQLRAPRGGFVHTNRRQISHWQINLDGVKPNGPGFGTMPLVIVHSGTILLAGSTTDATSAVAPLKLSTSALSTLSIAVPRTVLCSQTNQLRARNLLISDHSVSARPPPLPQPPQNLNRSRTAPEPSIRRGV